MARNNPSLQAVRKVFLVDVPANIERDGRAHLIRTAREGIAQITKEQTARSGIAPDVEVYANQPGNANLESVRIPGPIVALFDYRREIVMKAIQALEAASPVQSGDYKLSHLIFLNGAVVDALPPKLKRGDVVHVANPIAYARRIEIGKTKSGRDFVIQVPNRIYERVAKGPAMRPYRNLVRVTFTYIDPMVAYTVRGKLASHYTSGKFGPAGKHFQKKRNQKPGSKVRAPALEIRVL